ncbi:MAG: coenzyme-B sulfoethylthiotransferase subunit beta [Candidatus Methanofastidiosa archaeon]|nr:coenzyme-B sulfoethylthiotransferase subunit beta [Candidatus Methanofastidiosa archaeon]
MPKYQDKIDLYDNRGKLIEADVPLEAISPLKNPAIKSIISLVQRTVAVDLEAIQKSMAKAKFGKYQILGRGVDLPIVENAEAVRARVNDIIKVEEGDATRVELISSGKRLLIEVPTQRIQAEYTAGITAAGAAVVQAIIDEFDVSMFDVDLVKAAVWGNYPQTVNLAGANIKTILDVPQMNEGLGYALRNIMVNHIVAITDKRAMDASALAAIFEQTAMYEMGDAFGAFERQHLLGLAYQGLNADNLVLDLVKENGKGTVGNVIESLVGRAIEDKVIYEEKKLPSGYRVYNTKDTSKWNAYAAAGMQAAVMVNCGAMRAAQAIPSTILYYNDLIEHETSLPGVDFGRAHGTSVGMSFFSHSIYGGGGPGIFNGNHVVTRHSKGYVIPAIAAGMALDAGTQMFSPELTSGLFKEVLSKVPEFNQPLKYVAEAAVKIKGGL